MYFPLLSKAVIFAVLLGGFTLNVPFNFSFLICLSSDETAILLLFTLPLFVCFPLLVMRKRLLKTYSRAKIYVNEPGKNMGALARLGVAVDHGEHRPNVWFISDFSAAELKAIMEVRFVVEILRENMAAYYAQRNHTHGETHKTEADQDVCSLQEVYDYAVPEGFNLGSMAGYFTYEELLAHLDNMRALYPHLISARAPIDTFQTEEGRPIYWLKLSDNPDTDETDEPEC